jgi:TonB-linked SusC/RagA family outer membrane protein
MKRCYYFLRRLKGLMPFLLLPVSLSAQQITVKGTVTDQISGHSLIGVSVGVKGLSLGTVTDANGHYSIAVPGGSDTLVFTYIGYSTKEIPLASRSRVDATLAPDQENLNEVVVIGYGTQKKKDVTGAVTRVDPRRLENLPNSNLAQALEGAVPGLNITQTAAGAEGNTNTILIRGKNSITAQNDPLIILDGIPFNGNLSDINPNDVASIDVLEDASAAAIYGSRGSNGVILVTTKKGGEGKPVITYDGSYSVQEIAHMPTYLTPEQFYQFKLTRVPSSMTLSEQHVYDSRAFPDWVGLATQKGRRTQHNLSVRGGSEKVQYYISGNYLGVDGIAENDRFKRVSTRVNLTVNVTNWLTWGTNTQLAYINRNGLPADFSSAQNGAYAFNPLTTAFDSTGAPTIYPWPENTGFANPLSPALADNKDESYTVFSNNYILVKIPFVQGLSYRLNTGVEYDSRNQKTYYGRGTKIGKEANGNLSLEDDLTRNLTVENIVSYNRSFGKHTIDFTGLYSYEYDNDEANLLHSTGFPNDVLTYYQANIALSNTPSAIYSKSTMVSQMARINYSYNDKYLLTLTGRRDGYSGFGADKKFGFFPSAAVAWNIGDEDFLKNSRVLSNLKLRLSYGSNGNQAIRPYQTLAKLASRPYVDGSTTAPGYVPTSLADPNLGWETTNTANVGVDFALWKGRVQGSVDAYVSKTHDLLLNRLISPVEGVSSITENIGKTSNHGITIGLNTINVETDRITWSTNLNFSLNRNQIDELYGNGLDDTLNQWFLGHPIDVNFGLVYDGVYQQDDDIKNSAQPSAQPGFAKIKDLNGDGMINGQDRTIVGSQQPSFIWGMSNTFRYRQFSLYVFMHGVVGTSRFNSLLSDDVNSDVAHNTVVKDWWTPDNPTNAYYANVVGANQYGVSILQKNSYFRMEDISLSYDFSSAVVSRIGLSKLRLYVDARNLFTITQWQGLDPELSNQAGIPLQREYLLGLNIDL